MSLFPRKARFPSLAAVPMSVWRHPRRVVMGVVVLALIMPLFGGGGLQAVVLNAAGLAFAGWVFARCHSEWDRGRRRHRPSRQDEFDAPVAPRRRGFFMPVSQQPHGRRMDGTSHATRKAHEHYEAVALLEELAEFLRTPMNVVQELAQRVTGKPWAELDMAGAEETAKVLSEALHRILVWQARRTG